MAGQGSALSFMSLDESGLNFTQVSGIEFMEWEAEEGTTWVGRFSQLLKLEKSLHDEIVIAAAERGLVIIPNETQRACFNITDRDLLGKKLTSGARLVRTAFPAINVCCRQNVNVVLQVQVATEHEEHPTPNRYHVSVYNSQWAELHTFSWPFLSSDGQQQDS